MSKRSHRPDVKGITGADREELARRLPPLAARVLSAGGLVGMQLASGDFASATLGPVSSWSTDLWLALGLSFGLAEPASIWWGPELAAVGNEAWLSLVTRFDPSWSLGKPGPEIWGNAAKDVVELAEQARESARTTELPRPTVASSQPHSFALSPVWSVEGQIAGLLCVARPARVPVFVGTDSEEAGLELTARRQSSKRLARLHEHLSTAAHELKTPMTTLSLQLDSLLRKLATSADVELSKQELDERAAVCQRQIDWINDLLERLLDVSSLQSGNTSLSNGRVDLVAVVRNAADRLGHKLATSGSELRIAGDDEVVGDWDEVRLGQIASNLLSNAIKYGDGEPIDVLVERRGAVARLIVHDHGVGIGEANIQRIFEQFERGDANPVTTGVGLGLYIAYGIVEAMNGTLDVTSRRGAGSTFCVELPVSVGG